MKLREVSLSSHPAEEGQKRDLTRSTFKLCSFNVLCILPSYNWCGFLFCFKCFFLFVLMWIIFKVFIESVTTMFLFYVLGFLSARHSIRDWTHVPHIGRPSLHLWASRDLPQLGLRNSENSKADLTFSSSQHHKEACEFPVDAVSNCHTSWFQRTQLYFSLIFILV